jgi:hypothetical protein
LAVPGATHPGSQLLPLDPQQLAGHAAAVRANLFQICLQFDRNLTETSISIEKRP